jgi:phospholipase C
MSHTATALAAMLLAGTAQAAPAFKHIVIIFQENRSTDNLFGSNPTFEPGVDIATTGLAPHGQTIALTPVPLNGCYDLDHSHRGFDAMYHGGKMDGAQNVFVQFNGTCIPGANPQYRYVDNSTGTVQPYFDLARQYGFDNRMFQTNEGPSFPAHQFMFGGTSAPTTTSRLFTAENMDAIGGAGCTAPAGQRVLVIDYLGSEADYPPVYPCFDRPTMAELLDGAGLTWKYYINTDGAGSIWTAPAAIKNICGAQKQNGVLTCAAPEFVNNVPQQQGQVLTDIANCHLPSVTWVIPSAADSDHAEINAGTGPAWVASIVNAIGTQPACPGGDTYWNNTAIFITWDDWGGWYDHVPPFHVSSKTTNHWGDGYTYGFRVPLIVVSAYTQAGFVANKPHDFGSILRFVESNFNLATIGPGYYADAFATTIDGFFSLTTPRPYQVIQASPGGAYFLSEPRSNTGPDDD